MEIIRFVWKVAWTLIWVFILFKLITYGWFYWRAGEDDREVIRTLWRQSHTPWEFFKGWDRYISDYHAYTKPTGGGRAEDLPLPE